MLSAEHLLTKADALARPSAPEVYVAMTLPDLSPGWYRSGARDALWAVWNETLSLPVPCEAELTVLGAVRLLNRPVVAGGGGLKVRNSS